MTIREADLIKENARLGRLINVLVKELTRHECSFCNDTGYVWVGDSHHGLCSCESGIAAKAAAETARIVNEREGR